MLVCAATTVFAGSLPATAVEPAGGEPFPAAPSNLQVIAHHGQNVKVIWQDNSTNEARFVIQVQIPGWDYQDWQDLRDHRDSQPAATGWSEWTVVRDHRYGGWNCFRVFARNAGWQPSDPSNERCLSFGTHRVPNVVERTANQAFDAVVAAGLVPDPGEAPERTCNRSPQPAVLGSLGAAQSG